MITLDNNTQIQFQIIRSPRRTIALEITRTGQVLVRAPKHMAETEIHRFVQEKSDWLMKHLQRREIEKAVLEEAGKFTEEEVRKLVRLAKKIIPDKVSYYARLMNVGYGRISIRKQKSRWGSCSREGNLNFNCLLIMAPAEVLDYVVVHELSHRLEMNHSTRFWAHVESVLPNYKSAKKWLKEHGGVLMLRLHGEE